jgi:RNA polymerase sigma-70 factor (ECF subfamily)
VKSWLFTILRREFRRALERRGAEPPLPEDFDPDALPAAGGAVGDALAMRQLLASIPAAYSEPLILQVLGGFSCSVIAAMLDTSEGAIMTRLTRARQALRRPADPPSMESLTP